MLAMLWAIQIINGKKTFLRFVKSSRIPTADT